ncbi:DNA topoisomerase III [Isachenkonia alkalipeptolytica]|uniref:DNA topoisomerase 3 n=1 Tax=Isachenkonia alkalipeptolytica TaxID=2565777 RepID=A0AA44BDM2_9CLOT|nr:DNA topoisomerase III [Isachenkonia alkalipeptolytica]NBG87270.1 DNA topoisomerase III [Isachenkonia alkalipeptolytica]
MSKTLVLAEKPSVGRDIAKVLRANKKNHSHMEGPEYIVTWALGHLVTLQTPEKYDKRYQSWNMEDLPMLPEPMKLEVIPQTSKQFGQVKKLMHRKDVKTIVIATDAGREGELVARWIIQEAGVKKPIKRLWISSVTDGAIKKGFANLKEGKDYYNLFQSAVARSEADWIVGMNATRALTCKHNAQLSCGRVQTPTLAMIGQREEEIQNFTPKSYYGLKLAAKGVSFTWFDEKSGSNRTFSKEKAENVLKKVEKEKALLSDIQKQKKKQMPPALYDLTELQREANKRFDFSAKETLRIMQGLYESHKVLTYPRTDSRYLSSDIVETLEERVKAVALGNYQSAARKILQKPIKGNKNVVNDQKVSDHHAIIPTEERVQISKMSDSERKIYDLVVKRFLSVLMPPFEYEANTVKISLGGETFLAKGKKVISPGWRSIEKDMDKREDSEDQEDQQLPEFKKGEDLGIKSLQITEGKTTPPGFFNEGTLLSAMENPKKYLTGTGKKLEKALSETGGLGTVATRGDIIDKLFNTFLIEKKGKDIRITAKGKQLLSLVPKDLKAPDLTANWEQKLSDIAAGKLSKKDFVSEMKAYTKIVVKDVKSSSATFKHDNITGNRCPECDKYLLEVKGKRGKMLVCRDRECGYRKNVAKATNARCPNCHKKMELRGQGEGQIFTCPCGHREKLSAFQNRKKEKGAQASKGEVQKFLKKQEKEKEEPINTGLADQLAKLKLTED